jgi:tetratricopeptide (TPR) repeat protein
MSSADASKAQTFFQYGNEAALKSNFDYAIEMYQRACKLAPENLLYRQALRGTERKKFQNDPSKVGRLVGARLHPIRLKMRGPKSKQNWSQVLEICEEAFVLHPWDVTTAREAAEAAEHLGHDLLAQWLLESVAAQATDADFFRHIAAVHALNENWQKAIQAWERVKKIEPTDEVANRMINQLSASSTIQRSGLGDALEQREAAPAAEEQGPDLEELARRKLTPEQRRVKEIQEDPQRVSSYLHLSELLKEKNQLEEAEKVLARGIKVNPDSPELRFAHAEVQIRRLQHAVGPGPTRR